MGQGRLGEGATLRERMTIFAFRAIFLAREGEASEEWRRDDDRERVGVGERVGGRGIEAGRGRVRSIIYLHRHGERGCSGADVGKLT